MLWYLANGSLNEYLKSQIELQGQYYSGQKTLLVQADFSNKTGIVQFTGLTLNNSEGFDQPIALAIDEVSAQLVNNQAQQLSPNLIVIKKLTINKLKLWLERKDSSDNLTELQQHILIQLATDYPKLYPEFSAMMFAQKHPELNAELNAEFISQELDSQAKLIETAAAIEAKQNKSKGKIRGKISTKIRIIEVAISSLEFNSFTEGKPQKKSFKGINLAEVGGNDGIETNQLGGELLRLLLATALTMTPQNPVQQ